MAPTVRICMLNADVPVPSVVAQSSPTYGHIFHTLLAQASPGVEFHSTDFDVIQDEYPSSLAAFDAIIVSGSANSAYDDLPWIHRLEQYILDVYNSHPRVKIFGSCFGHQIICQSLLKPYGVHVRQDPNGWELGVKQVQLHGRFLDMFATASETFCSDDDDGQGRLCENLRLQFVHHDHVVIPSLDLLPQQWTIVGSTQHCAVQGIFQPRRILTFQGHFEFDRFLNSETVKYFFESSWEPDRLGEALLAINMEDDSVVAARVVGEFLTP